MDTPYAFPTEFVPIVEAQLKFHFLLKVLPWIAQRKFFLLSVTMCPEVLTDCVIHWVLVYHALLITQPHVY